MQVKVKAHTMHTKDGRTVQVRESTSSRADSKKIAMNLAGVEAHEHEEKEKEQKKKPAGSSKGHGWENQPGQRSIFDALEETTGKRHDPGDKRKIKKTPDAHESQLSLFGPTPTAPEKQPAQRSIFDAIREQGMNKSILDILDELEKAIVQVKQHERKTKTGATVQVMQHERNILTSGEKKDLVSELASKIGKKGGAHVKGMPANHVHHLARALAKHTGKTVHMQAHSEGGYTLSHEKPEGVGHLAVTEHDTTIMHPDHGSVTVSHSEARKVLKRADKKPQEEKETEENKPEPKQEEATQKAEEKRGGNNRKKTQSSEQIQAKIDKLSAQQTTASDREKTKHWPGGSVGEVSAREMRGRAKKIDDTIDRAKKIVELEQKKKIAEANEHRNSDEFKAKQAKLSEARDNIEQVARSLPVGSSVYVKQLENNYKIVKHNDKTMTIQASFGNMAIPYRFSDGKNNVIPTSEQLKEWQAKKSQEHATDKSETVKPTQKSEDKPKKAESDDKAGGGREMVEQSRTREYDRAFIKEPTKKREQFDRIREKSLENRVEKAHANRLHFQSAIEKRDLKEKIEREDSEGRPIKDRPSGPVAADYSKPVLISYDQKAKKPIHGWHPVKIEGQAAHSNGWFALLGDAKSGSSKYLKGNEYDLSSHIHKPGEGRLLKPVGWSRGYSFGDNSENIWFHDGSSINAGIYDHIRKQYPGADFFLDTGKEHGAITVVSGNKVVGVVSKNKVPPPPGIEKLVKDSNMQKSVLSNHVQYGELADAYKAIAQDTYDRMERLSALDKLDDRQAFALEKSVSLAIRSSADATSRAENIGAHAYILDALRRRSTR